MRPQAQRSYGNKTRTREDKAIALNMRLVMPPLKLIAQLIEGHTVETFARAHGVTPAMIRDNFERAVAKVAAL